MKCPQCNMVNRDNARFCLGCGRRLTPVQSVERKAPESPPTARVKRRKTSGPQTIQKGRYLVIQKLGSGGMSRVYLARDTKMDFNVVVKEMFPPKSYPEKKEYFLRKFKNEAKLLFRLRHPGIPRVTDYFAEGDNYYMVMEYIEGENIDTILKNREGGRITLDEMFKWFNSILSIIKFLHNQNPPIFHRDIKPANFMLDSQGDIYLVDFGVAKAMSLKEAHTRIGTIGYASPEHFTGKFINSSDLFSLGASFHYMLSGDDPRFRLPFDFPPLSVYRDDLPEGLEDMINQMMEKDPRNRFPSVEYLQKDFSKIEQRYYEDLKTGKEPVRAKPVKPRQEEQAPEEPAEAKEGVSEEAGEEEAVTPVKSGRLSLPIFKRIRRAAKPGAKRAVKSDSDEDEEIESKDAKDKKESIPIAPPPAAPLRRDTPSSVDTVKEKVSQASRDVVFTEAKSSVSENAGGMNLTPLASKSTPPAGNSQRPVKPIQQPVRKERDSMPAQKPAYDVKVPEIKITPTPMGQIRSKTSSAGTGQSTGKTSPSRPPSETLHSDKPLGRTMIPAKRAEHKITAKPNAVKQESIRPEAVKPEEITPLKTVEAAPSSPKSAPSKIQHSEFKKNDLPERPGTKKKKTVDERDEWDEAKEAAEKKAALSKMEPSSQRGRKKKDSSYYGFGDDDEDEEEVIPGITWDFFKEQIKKNFFVIMIVIIFSIVFAFTYFMAVKYFEKNRSSEMENIPVVTETIQTNPSQTEDENKSETNKSNDTNDTNDKNDTDKTDETDKIEPVSFIQNNLIISVRCIGYKDANIIGKKQLNSMGLVL